MWCQKLLSKLPFHSQSSLRHFSLSIAAIENTVISHLKALDGVNAKKITQTCSFKDIGLDSLAQIEMYAALEDIFKIILNDEESQSIKTLPDLIRIISSKNPA